MLIDGLEYCDKCLVGHVILEPFMVGNEEAFQTKTCDICGVVDYIFDYDTETTSRLLKKI